ncbi:hypothetical protein [Facklamia hominis]|uniref:Uncharacterized protein n=1 Tax=Facklamia hominis TaxID=178214 RepID=A0AAJ1V3M0_9LACT|nr:hypothetical protein [Facklamia hominis]MDK7187501.1 hypothetical protein [Facklamia hominis]
MRTEFEIKKLIKCYQTLDTSIKQLKISLANVSPNYYATHSFTGTGITNLDEAGSFQRAISPERATLEIIGMENRIKKKIKRYELRKARLSGVPRITMPINGDSLTYEELAYFNLLIKLERTIRPIEEDDEQPEKKKVCYDEVMDELYA